MTYNIVLVSGIQESGSFTHIHMFTLFKDSFKMSSIFLTRVIEREKGI